MESHQLGFLLFVSLAYKSPGQVLEGFPSVRGGCMEKRTTKKESSTNGKLVLWGPVVWIPGILLRIVTWVLSLELQTTSLPIS